MGHDPRIKASHVEALENTTLYARIVTDPSAQQETRSAGDRAISAELAGVPLLVQRELILKGKKSGSGAKSAICASQLTGSTVLRSHLAELSITYKPY